MKKSKRSGDKGQIWVKGLEWEERRIDGLEKVRYQMADEKTEISEV